MPQLNIWLGLASTECLHMGNLICVECLHCLASSLLLTRPTEPICVIGTVCCTTHFDCLCLWLCTIRIKLFGPHVGVASSPTRSTNCRPCELCQLGRVNRINLCASRRSTLLLLLDTKRKKRPASVRPDLISN